MTIFIFGFSICTFETFNQESLIMKIVLSPAKSLNFEKALPTQNFSEPLFLKESRLVHKVLKQKSPKELSELMDISDKLADLNWQRNQDWKTPFTTENARPAVFAFDVDVYTGLDAYSIPTEKLEILQDKVRILSFSLTSIPKLYILLLFRVDKNLL